MLFIKNHYLLTSIDFDECFIRETPTEKNDASECIRIVAATYGRKILQLWKHDANSYGYKTNCE